MPEGAIEKDLVQLWHDIEAAFDRHTSKEGSSIETLKADVHAAAGSQSPASTDGAASAGSAAGTTGAGGEDTVAGAVADQNAAAAGSDTVGAGASS